MLTIIFNGHKITGEVKDIYEFIKLAESEVASEKNDEVDLGENDERWSTYYTTESIEKMDEETAERLKGKYGECGDCVAAWRDGVPCPDKDSYCPYKKHNSVEKGMKDFYRDLSWAERYLVCDIKNLKDSDVELVEFVGAYVSEHYEGQWLRFIISYFGGHDRFLEVNYEAKKFVYFKINEGLSVENLRLTEELKNCLLGYEQETVGKWWKK